MHHFFFDTDHPDLQLFAEGGDGGAGDAGKTGVNGSAGAVGSDAGSRKTGGKNALADVIYGKQAAGEQDAAAAGTQDAAKQDAGKPEDPDAEFEALIKGKYKDAFDRRVQPMMRDRVAKMKDVEDKYKKAEPLIGMLAGKYGVDAADLDGIRKAMESDEALYEKEAIERNLSVNEVRLEHQLKSANDRIAETERQRQMEEGRRAIIERWSGEAEQMKARYPDFDLRAEMQNAQFRDLIENNVSLEAAYIVTHKDSLIPAALHAAAKDAEARTAAAFASGQGRPREGATGSSSTPVIKSDVTTFSKADRDEICRRVARGGKIIL